MVIIKQLTDTSIEEIHRTFTQAFSDYVEPFDLSLDQLKHMIERRGYNPQLSFGAFSGDKLVGLTLNGIDFWQGKKTAYDTGTGIIPEFRRQGIAAKLFNESLPVLKENNVEQYLLEVIKTNTGAFELYKKSGFMVTREFDYYIFPKEDLNISDNSLPEEFRSEELFETDWTLLKSFWDFEPSWQNSIDSINRKRNYFKVFGIFTGDVLAGYGIIEVHTGDIPHLAISHEYRRKGLGKALLNTLLTASESKTVKFINPETTCFSFSKFMERLKIKPGDGQYEMILEL